MSRPGGFHAPSASIGALEGAAHERLMRQQQLIYVADLVGELSAIARRLNSPTLLGILEVAEREAQLEAERSLR